MRPEHGINAFWPHYYAIRHYLVFGAFLRGFAKRSDIFIDASDGEPPLDGRGGYATILLGSQATCGF